MLADELDARWQDMSFIEAPAEDEYANWALGKGFVIGGVDIPKSLVPTVDGLFMQVTSAMHLQITGGSASVRATGVYGMRIAGAAARELLIKAAAAQWEVPESELTAKHSQIIHSRSGRQANFSQFAAAAAQFKPSRTPRLKSIEDFEIMGRSVARHDIPSKVDGTAVFGIDADVPDMKYAAIKGAPVFGAQALEFNANGADQATGVLQIVNLGEAVAVVADGYWNASQALKMIDITWSKTGSEGLDSEKLFAQFERDIQAAKRSGDATDDVSIGDVEAAFERADKVVEANYRVPFLAHACMEPMNATARVDDNKCEVWVGSQNPLGFKYEIAKALEMDASQVALHQHTMGGGFGRRATSDVAVQAARIAKVVGVPVKLIWSREEDIRHDVYRPAIASQFRAALSDQGDVMAWENMFHEKHEPDEAPKIPYDIASKSIQYIESLTHVPFGPWRSVDHSQHGFFTESFFDEVAHAVDKDPYELRRTLLSDKPRHLAVLDRAAEEAGWGEQLAAGRGRGISLQQSFGSIVAQVVDVSVNQGSVKVDRVVCVIDPGFAVSPDGVRAQMESGIIYGLSAALYGDINIVDGAVKQGNFHDYQVVRMHEAPVIETHIINSGAAWGGAGEPGTPGIAPALANAVYQATGTRVRQLPLSNYDFSYQFVEEEGVI